MSNIHKPCCWHNRESHNGRTLSRSLTLHFTYSPSLSYEVIHSVKEQVKTHQKCFAWLPLKVSIPLSFTLFFKFFLASLSVHTEPLKVQFCAPVHTSNQDLSNTAPQLHPRHWDNERRPTRIFSLVLPQPADRTMQRADC